MHTRQPSFASSSYRERFTTATSGECENTRSYKFGYIVVGNKVYIRQSRNSGPAIYKSDPKDHGKVSKTHESLQREFIVQSFNLSRMRSFRKKKKKNYRVILRPLFMDRLLRRAYFVACDIEDLLSEMGQNFLSTCAERCITWRKPRFL